MRLVSVAFFAVGLFVVPSLSGCATAPTININPSITGVTNSNGTSVLSSSVNFVNKGWPVTGCPVTISFNARVTLSNWPANTPFVYEQYRSDGGKGPTWTVKNPANSFTAATWTWQLGANGTFAVELKPVSPPAGSTVNYTRDPFILKCPTTVNGKTVPGNFQDDASGFVGLPQGPNIPNF